MSLGRSWMNPKLVVKRSRSHEKGVFAKKAISKGERVAILGGDIMRIAEIERLPMPLRRYPMQIEERFVLGTRAGEPEDTDYFNHCCNPNTGFRGQVFLVALRNIQVGEEVTFDYAMVVSPSVGCKITFEMTCSCGAPGCRRSITERDWTIPELQDRYRGYFSQYLQEKIDSAQKRVK
jgi:SET domain-containing protein